MALSSLFHWHRPRSSTATEAAAPATNDVRKCITATFIRDSNRIHEQLRPITNTLLEVQGGSRPITPSRGLPFSGARKAFAKNRPTHGTPPSSIQNPAGIWSGTHSAMIFTLTSGVEPTATAILTPNVTRKWQVHGKLIAQGPSIGMLHRRASSIRPA